MSRRRKRSSGASCIVFAVVAIVALGVVLWRISPDRWRSWARPTAPPASEALSPGVTGSRAPGPDAHGATVTIYFARVVEGKLRLVPVTRELPPGPGVARAALDQLISGPVPAGCQRPLPPGVRLLGATVSDGIATVDFTEDLQTGFRGGSDNEGVVVYAIVNTLAALPTVDQVRILIEGESVSSLGGHLDLSAPLPFDDELVVAERQPT